MTNANPFQDHFDRMAEQYKEAVAEAVRGWTEAAQRLTAQPTSPSEVSAIIDGAFDVAELHLRTQREFTKGVYELLARGASTNTATTNEQQPTTRA